MSSVRTTAGVDHPLGQRDSDCMERNQSWGGSRMGGGESGKADEASDPLVSSLSTLGSGGRGVGTVPARRQSRHHRPRSATDQVLRDRLGSLLRHRDGSKDPTWRTSPWGRVTDTDSVWTCLYKTETRDFEAKETTLLF